jgi:surface polysaccharide O-acyltransferase-like enzyme
MSNWNVFEWKQRDAAPESAAASADTTAEHPIYSFEWHAAVYRNHRNANIDLLRVLGSMAVVWGHVSATVVLAHPDIHSFQWWAANIIDAFTRWSVPIFLLISGSLLLRSPSSSSFAEFYKKRAIRLLPPIVFWTAVYFVLRWFTEDNFGWKNVMGGIIAGTPYYHLWYIYMLIGLYLATPFLHLLVSKSNPNALRILILGLFAVSSIESALGSRGVTFFTAFVPLLGYYLAGYYLTAQRNEFKCSPPFLVSIAVLCAGIIAASAGALFPVFGMKAVENMYSCLNPIAVVMSICVFLLFLRTERFLPMCKLIRRLAPLTLGIYAIHPIWLSAIGKSGVTAFLLHPVIGIPVTVALAFTLSSLSTGLLARVPFLRRTVT